MLPKEGQQLWGGPVIGQLDSRHALPLQHCIKETPAKASSLTTFMDIEVENTQWVNFFERVLHTCMVGPGSLQWWRRHKQALRAYLNESQRTLVFYH